MRERAVLLVAGLAACATETRIAKVTLIASDPPRVAVQLEGTVVGKDCEVDVVGEPTLDEAIDLAEAKQPEADALASVRISRWSESYGVLVERLCLDVRGQAIRFGGGE